jgi:hypothetical protein
MEKRTIRIVLNEETFRKYKVYCAIENLSMTDQTNLIIKKFVDDTEKIIKIIKIDEKYKL